MKLGILTHWWSNDNYGQILQCYALQQFLKEIGYDSEIIRYKRDNDFLYSKWRYLKILNPLCVFRYLIRKVRKQHIPTRFVTFKNNIIYSAKIYDTVASLYEYDLNADIDGYIVGSDQVWNCCNLPIKQAINVKHAYFLDFVSTHKYKIAYAASFGSNAILPEYETIIKDSCESFDYLSVREESGIQVLSSCKIKKDVVSNPDPTLLLDKEQYINLLKKPEDAPKSDFIFVYLLENEYIFNFDILDKYSKEKQLEIYFVIGNSKGKIKYPFNIHYPSIEEWLYLVNNANYIITNSFHCGVFSTIFCKQYGIIPLDGVDVKMNDRFKTLFELVNIKSRFIYDDFSLLDRPYNADFSLIDERKLHFEKALNRITSYEYNSRINIK